MTTAPPRAARTRWRRPLLAALPWLSPVLAIGIWQWGSASGWISAGTLPAPSAVIEVGRTLWDSGELQRSLLVSLRRVAIGFTIGATIGLALGFLVGLSRIAEALIDRTLQAVRAIPHLALVPLIIIWFGIDETPKIILVALGTVFPVYLNTVNGVRTVDAKLITLGAGYGLSRRQILTQIVLPGALPSILTGIRYALGVAWLTLVIAETISSREGLGYLSQTAREQLRYDQLVLTIALYALAGLIADQIVRVIERITLRWHPSYVRGADRGGLA